MIIKLFSLDINPDLTDLASITGFVIPVGMVLSDVQDDGLLKGLCPDGVLITLKEDASSIYPLFVTRAVIEQAELAAYNLGQRIVLYRYKEVRYYIHPIVSKRSSSNESSRKDNYRRLVERESKRINDLLAELKQEDSTIIRASIVLNLSEAISSLKNAEANNNQDLYDILNHI